MDKDGELAGRPVHEEGERPGRRADKEARPFPSGGLGAGSHGGPPDTLGRETGTYGLACRAA